MEYKITDRQPIAGHDWIVEITLYPKTDIEKSLVNNFKLIGNHTSEEEALMDHLILSVSIFSLLGYSSHSDPLIPQQIDPPIFFS